MGGSGNDVRRRPHQRRQGEWRGCEGAGMAWEGVGMMSADVLINGDKENGVGGSGNDGDRGI